MSNVKNVIALTQETVANSTTGDINTDDNTLFIDKSADTVGINTSSPDSSFRLDIDGGPVRIQDVGSVNYGNETLTDVALSIGTVGNESAFIVKDEGSFGRRLLGVNSNTDIILGHAGGTSFFRHVQINTGTSGDIRFFSGATENGIFASNGNFGIGTTTPSDELTVSGNVTASYYHGDGSQLDGISAGATGGGSDQVFFLSDINVNNDFTIPTGRNALSAGPTAVNTGITVTVPSGSTWTIV